ncbi:MAG: hypothetical protein M1831_004287 [Alyxoria varia]|nr:MAG: hypothetical protein M1831_004287 [Alyxoria varia]
MTSAEATPRITAEFLETFQNKTVRVLGKVVALRGETATIDAGGQINVLLNRDCHFQTDHAVEVVGKVTNDLSIKVLAATEFGTNIDFSIYKAVVDATHNHREIFYDQ